MRSLTIKKLFILLAIGFTVLMATLIITFLNLTSNQDKISLSHRDQFQSYLLADELRQSSDDLTRLGRVYVITGDPSYKQQYLDILDIRNGKKPRPKEYHRIYWDFVAGGIEKPREDGRAVSLKDLMIESGFTDKEFGYLKKANDNSDGLVNLEIEAMNAIEGVFNDSVGDYSIKRTPTEEDLAHAANLVHGKPYHKYKAEIMEPVDQFFAELEERTKLTISDAEDSARSWTVLVVLVLACLAVFFLISGRILKQRVLNPIRRLQDAMVLIAEDHLDVEAPFIENMDEIGEMGRALENFRISILEGKQLRERVRLSDQADIAKQQEVGAEEERRASELTKTIGEFGQNISEMLATLTSSSKELQVTATGMTGIAETPDNQAGDAAAASQHASSNVEAVASATEELSACIKEIEDQIRLSADETKKARSGAEDASKQMMELQISSKAIRKVVGLINGIAEQTNLLALNATIEAAGASEAGRGFSVVASEIKLLATQTALATKDISSQINSVHAATATSSEAMKSVTQILENAEDMVTGVATAIQEQKTATDEIAMNIQEASSRNQRVSENIQSIASEVTQTKSASDQVLRASNEVASSSYELKNKIEGFLHTISLVNS